MSVMKEDGDELDESLRPRDEEFGASEMTISSKLGSFKSRRQMTETERIMQLRAGYGKYRLKASRLIDNPWFDGIMCAIILANCGVVLIETDHNAVCETQRIEAADVGGPEDEPPSCEHPGWIGAINRVFLVIYTLECGIRIFVERRTYVTKGWNLFDVTIVFLGVVGDVLEGVMPFSLGYLRVFRVARLVRAVRVMVSFEELRAMLLGFVGAMKTLMYASIMLFMLLSFWAIAGVSVFHPIAMDLLEEKPEAFDGCERCPRAFRNVTNGLITLFQTIIAGDSWGQFAVPMIEYRGVCILLFVPIIFTVGFGLLNLVTAVIVQAAVQSRETGADEKRKEQDRLALEAKKNLIQICEDMDDDKNGSVTLEELIDGSETNPAFARQLKMMQVDVQDLKQVFEFMDSDNSGSVTYNEFADQIYKMKSQDTKTILSFVKFYVMDIRQSMRLQLEIVNRDVIRRDEEQGEVMKDVLKHLTVLADRAEKTGCESSAVLAPLHRRPALQPLHLANPGDSSVSAAVPHVVGEHTAAVGSVGGELPATAPLLPAQLQVITDRLQSELGDLRILGRRFEEWNGRFRSGQLPRGIPMPVSVRQSPRPLEKAGIIVPGALSASAGAARSDDAVRSAGAQSAAELLMMSENRPTDSRFIEPIVARAAR